MALACVLVITELTIGHTLDVGCNNDLEGQWSAEVYKNQGKLLQLTDNSRSKKSY